MAGNGVGFHSDERCRCQIEQQAVHKGRKGSEHFQVVFHSTHPTTSSSTLWEAASRGPNDTSSFFPPCGKGTEV
jgi:hypothetical protein